MVESQTSTPKIDDRDWSALTLGERIRQIEVGGYVLIPDLLSTEQIAKLKVEVATLETQGMDYSEHQRVAGDAMFLGGEIAEPAAHPTTISFLRALLGEDVICVKGDYPNRSNEGRDMVAYAYRPGWRGPGEERPPWDQTKLEALPPHVRELFADPNTHYDDHFRGNRPPDLASDAPGIGPARWESPG